MLSQKGAVDAKWAWTFYKLKVTWNSGDSFFNRVKSEFDMMIFNLLNQQDPSWRDYMHSAALIKAFNFNLWRSTLPWAGKFKRILLNETTEYTLLGCIHVCVDLDLRNENTKRELKELTWSKMFSQKYWFLQNYLTPFMKLGFRYWVSWQYSVLSFELWSNT